MSIQQFSLMTVLDQQSWTLAHGTGVGAGRFWVFCRSWLGVERRLVSTRVSRVTGRKFVAGREKQIGHSFFLKDGQPVSDELEFAEIFRDDDQVEVLAADWSTMLDRGPFSLLFLDSGKPSASGPDKVVELMDEGGIVVLDDFTPCQSWPPLFEGRVDTLREQWLSDERFAAVEVLVAPDASAVLATKR